MTVGTAPTLTLSVDNWDIGTMVRVCTWYIIMWNNLFTMQLATVRVYFNAFIGQFFFFTKSIRRRVNKVSYPVVSCLSL